MGKLILSQEYQQNFNTLLTSFKFVVDYDKDNPLFENMLRQFEGMSQILKSVFQGHPKLYETLIKMCKIVNCIKMGDFGPISDLIENFKKLQKSANLGSFDSNLATKGSDDLNKTQQTKNGSKKQNQTLDQFQPLNLGQKYPNRNEVQGKKTHGGIGRYTGPSLNNNTHLGKGGGNPFSQGLGETE